MDYGQTNPTYQSAVPQDFFTVGAGVNDPNVNNFEPENNLDVSSGEWGDSIGHDTQNIGKSALREDRRNEGRNMPGGDTTAEFIPFEFMPGASELPIVAAPSMAPDAPPVSPSRSTNKQSAQPPAINLDNIKTSESLSELGAQEVVKAINQLNKDDKIADFYDAARQMMTANLKNSYGDRANWRLDE